MKSWTTAIGLFCCWYFCIPIVKGQQTLAVRSILDTAKRIEQQGQFAAEEMIQSSAYAQQLSPEESHSSVHRSDPLAQASIFMKKGLQYRKQSLYAPAIDNFLKAYRIYEEHGNRHEIANLHNEIGMVYWQQRDLEQAIFHHQLALDISLKLNAKKITAISYKNLGVVHFYKKAYPKALKYYDAALYEAKSILNQDLLPTLYNNIGIVYAHQGEYEQALSFYQEALKANLSEKDIQLIAALYDNIGDVYRKMGNFETAKVYLEKGLEKATAAKAVHRMMESQESLFQLYQQQGQYQMALQHYQAHIQLKDSLINANNSRQIAELRADYEGRKKDRDIELLKKSEDLLLQQQMFDELLKVVLVGSILSVVIIAGLIVNRQRLKLWKRKELIERQQQEHETREALVKASLENEQLAKQALEREIDFKNQQISANTLHIIQKQQFLEEMKTQVAGMSQRPTSAQLKKLIKQIDHRLNMTKEWEQINQTLEQVNANFYDKLQKICPSLTPNELRVCLLAKLNFSIKEMAILLKIAPNSVAIARHRIRKKLNLPQEENLSKFMMNIS